MRTRRAYIPQRRPIFVGCEGESEQGYAGFLQDLVREADLSVHLMIEVLLATYLLQSWVGSLSRSARLRS